MIDTLHVVGIQPDGQVYIVEGNPDVDTSDPATDALLRYVVASAGAIPIGWIRASSCQTEDCPCGATFYAHGFFFPDTSPAEREVMQGAALRVMCSGTGHIDEVDGAERAIEGVKFLERDLGIGEAQ